jgi:hypothetical protein
MNYAESMLDTIRRKHKTHDDLLDAKLIECSEYLSVLLQMAQYDLSADEMRALAKDALKRVTYAMPSPYREQ